MGHINLTNPHPTLHKAIFQQHNNFGTKIDINRSNYGNYGYTKKAKRN